MQTQEQMTPEEQQSEDYWREATESAQSEAADPDAEPAEDLG